MRDASAHKFPHAIAGANSRDHAVDDPADAVADHFGPVDYASRFVGYADHAAGHRLPVSHAAGDVECTTDHREPQQWGRVL